MLSQEGLRGAHQRVAHDVGLVRSEGLPLQDILRSLQLQTDRQTETATSTGNTKVGILSSSSQSYPLSVLQVLQPAHRLLAEAIEQLRSPGLHRLLAV